MIDTLSTLDAFDIVKNSRQWLKNHPASTETSEKTKQEYARELMRLISKAEEYDAKNIWAAICATQKKTTFQKRKIAARDGCSSLIEQMLRSQDEKQRNKDQDAWLLSVRSLNRITTIAKDLHALLEASKGACPLENPVKKTSKRSMLSSLPYDWREQMLAHLSLTPHKQAFLLAAVTGLRPIEMKLGVTLTLSERHMSIRIDGAKVKENQGQPWRTIRYEIDEGKCHPLVWELYSCLWKSPQDNGEHTISARPVAFTSAVRRAGNRVDKKTSEEITPYCLRHQFASDLKRTLGDEDLISEALGQSVSATRKLYGRARSSSRNPLLPTGIKAAREIRQTHTHVKNLVTSLARKAP